MTRAPIRFDRLALVALLAAALLAVIGVAEAQAQQYYNIVNRWNALCVDVAHASQAHAATVVSGHCPGVGEHNQQWSRSPGFNQQWIFTAVGPRDGNGALWGRSARGTATFASPQTAAGMRASCPKERARGRPISFGGSFASPDVSGRRSAHEHGRAHRHARVQQLHVAHPHADAAVRRARADRALGGGAVDAPAATDA